MTVPKLGIQSVAEIIAIGTDGKIRVRHTSYMNGTLEMTLKPGEFNPVNQYNKKLSPSPQVLVDANHTFDGLQNPIGIDDKDNIIVGAGGYMYVFGPEKYSLTVTNAKTKPGDLVIIPKYGNSGAAEIVGVAANGKIRVRHTNTNWQQTLLPGEYNRVKLYDDKTNPSPEILLDANHRYDGIQKPTGMDRHGNIIIGSGEQMFVFSPEDYSRTMKTYIQRPPVEIVQAKPIRKSLKPGVYKKGDQVFIADPNSESDSPELIIGVVKADSEEGKKLSIQYKDGEQYIDIKLKPNEVERLVEEYEGISAKSQVLVKRPMHNKRGTVKNVGEYGTILAKYRDKAGEHLAGLNIDEYRISKPKPKPKKKRRSYVPADQLEDPNIVEPKPIRTSAKKGSLEKGDPVIVYIPGSMSHSIPAVVKEIGKHKVTVQYEDGYHYKDIKLSRNNVERVVKNYEGITKGSEVELTQSSSKDNRAKVKHVGENGTLLVEYNVKSKKVTGAFAPEEYHFNCPLYKLKNARVRRRD